MSGCNENVLHVWKIVNTEDDVKSLTNGESLNAEESELDDLSVRLCLNAQHKTSVTFLNYKIHYSNELIFFQGKLKCVRVQSIQRSSKGRVTSLKTDFSGQTVVCQGTDNTYDLFYFCPEDQISKRQSKRYDKKICFI